MRTAQGHPSTEWRIMKGKVVAGYRKIRPGGRAVNDIPVHHLVLIAFGFERPPGAEVRHLDSNKLNNALVNLCWGTPAENYRDREGNGTLNDGERNGRAVLTEDQVREIRSMTATNRALAIRFGVSVSTISAVRLWRTWKLVA